MGLLGPRAWGPSGPSPRPATAGRSGGRRRRTSAALHLTLVTCVIVTICFNRPHMFRTPSRKQIQHRKIQCNGMAYGFRTCTAYRSYTHFNDVVSFILGLGDLNSGKNGKVPHSTSAIRNLQGKKKQSDADLEPRCRVTL